MPVATFGEPPPPFRARPVPSTPPSAGVTDANHRAQSPHPPHHVIALTVASGAWQLVIHLCHQAARHRVTSQICFSV